jgi:voltage-gated potassium channel
MMGLSLLIIPVLLLPMAWPSMPAPAKNALDAADTGIWMAFAAEYLLLLVLAPARGGYVRTHLVELALVLLPMLRPLRLLRSARLLRLARVGRVVAGAASAAKVSRRHLATSAPLYAPAATMLLILAAAAVARDAERMAPGANIKSYGDAAWWALTTVTTVGYGDRYPVTTTGRAVAVGLMVVGVALLAIITASMAAAFTRWTAAPAEQEAADGDAIQAADLATVLEELRALRSEVALLRGERSTDSTPSLPNACTQDVGPAPSEGL